jgi:lactate dehydrogenase-like 2-hydroxyacid dehydrogenase
MSEVTVVIGAGSIGQAIARRVSAGKQVLLADLRQGNAEVAAEVLRNAEFGNVIARGGAGVVISSQSGHRRGALTAEQDAAGYRRMIELCPVGRGGTPDEVATVGALLMGPDVLMDGGVTAAYFFGDLAPQ